MRKIISLDGETTPTQLIQLIAESESSEPADIHSDDDNLLFVKRHRLCVLLNDIEFTIENYGIINFFIEYADQIPELKELGDLLMEFDHHSTVSAISKALSFFELNQARFEHLESDPDDYDSVHSSLLADIKDLSEDGNFYIPLNESIKELALYIKSNHKEFFITSNL